MEYPVEAKLILRGSVFSTRFVVRCDVKAEIRAGLKFSPSLNSRELGIVAENGDRLRHVGGVFEDKLHVLCRAQADKQQVLGGDVLAQHIGNVLSFTLLRSRLHPIACIRLVCFLCLILKDTTRTVTMLSTMHTITAHICHHKYQFAPFCGGFTTVDESPRSHYTDWVCWCC